MKIAIHNMEESFSTEWVEYCKSKEIPYKLVDCYQSDIISQLHDCDALMWHFHHAIPQDTIFARQLLYSVQASGKVVFPDFNTMWHFDDKLGQKYLLEAVKAPHVNTYTFYNKNEAIRWINSTTFPKVFKLRVGASSQNVKLVTTRKEALALTRKAFGRGLPQYSQWETIRENIRKYKLGDTTLLDIFKQIIRLVYRSEFARFSDREKGYVYFQDFIAGNESDLRIVVIDNKAFGERRLVRQNDFRASGSHMRLYDKELIDEKALKTAFEISEKLGLQCTAYDFVFENGEPLILEISYGTTIQAYKPCPGYWDKDLNFYEGEFDFCHWMVDTVVKTVNQNRLSSND